MTEQQTTNCNLFEFKKDFQYPSVICVFRVDSKNFNWSGFTELFNSCSYSEIFSTDTLSMRSDFDRSSNKFTYDLNRIITKISININANTMAGLFMNFLISLISILDFQVSRREEKKHPKNKIIINQRSFQRSNTQVTNKWMKILFDVLLPSIMTHNQNTCTEHILLNE